MAVEHEPVDQARHDAPQGREIEPAADVVAADVVPLGDEPDPHPARGAGGDGWIPV